jgi:DNA-binding LacI/PurR family transcriptional regulator
MAKKQPHTPKKPVAKKVSTTGKRLTIADIARAADVSIGLVSSFLTGRDYAGNGKSGIRIGEATAQRIRDVCRELDYRPDRPSAFNRIYPERGEVALAGSTDLSFHINRYYSMILDGVVDGGKESGVKVSVIQFDPKLDYEKYPEELPRSVQDGDIQKFILVGAPNLSFVRCLIARGLKVVYLSRFIDVPGVLSIVPDYAAAAATAVNYLASLGHQQIAFIALSYFKDSWHCHEFMRGATTAMDKLGITHHPDNLRFAEPNLDVVVMDLMRRRKRRPTALFAFDDLSAEYALHTLVKNGIRVPEEVSIVGCNDERQAALGSLPLSTIHLPVTQMGTRAVSEANQLAVNGTLTEPRTIVLPVYLIERATSGRI